MSKPQRASIGGRNTAAITQSASVTEAPEAPAPIKTADAQPKATTPDTAKPVKSAQASDTVRQGIYITADEFQDAKAAYLADWQAGGQSDTFAKWIGAVIDEHAGRTAADRARLARPGGRAETRTGASRSFNVPADTIARMRAAIAEDQAAGRWPSDSAWCGDAITAAVERARTRDGGTLPTPPERLPNRLRR